MAELKGPFLFTGSIGNIRAYYNKTLKRYFISGKGGSNKKLIANNPAFARQLENMSEFKGCGIWSSQLRKVLISICHLQKGYYFSQIVSMAKSIQKHDDVSQRGVRSITSSKDARLLTTLCFNRFYPFDQVLTHQYQILFSDDRKTVTAKLLGFRSFSRIKWPVRFDSYRLSLVIAQLADVVWNENYRCYQPVVPHLGRLSVCTLSDWRPCSAELEDIVLEASFAQPALQQPGTTVIVALGIEVSVATGSASSLKPMGIGTMRIVECFV